MGLTELRKKFLEHFGSEEFKTLCLDFKVANPSLTFDYDAHLAKSLNYEEIVQETIKRLDRESKLLDFVAFLKKERPDVDFEALYSSPSNNFFTEFPLIIESIGINPDTTFQNIGLSCGFGIKLHHLTPRNIYNIKIGLIGLTLANENVQINPTLLSKIVIKLETGLFLLRRDFPNMDVEPFDSVNTCPIGPFVLSSYEEKLYTWQAAAFLTVEEKTQWYQLEVNVENPQTFWNQSNRWELVKFEICTKPIVACLKRTSK